MQPLSLYPVVKRSSGRWAFTVGAGGAALAGVLVFAFSALAQVDTAADVASTAGFGDADLVTIIGKVIGIALSVVGIVFLVLIIYAGYTWMTAGGDPKRVDKAKQILINATVGLVLTLSAYAISSFIINALSDAASSGDGDSSNGSVSVERFSNALGSGAIRDHYPERNATDVARNTRIYVTFKEAMDIASFVDGYDVAGTPEDVSDDTTATVINTDRVKIYATADGEDAALTAVAVTFTDDLKTFVFDPGEYLGSATSDTSYTVALDDGIEDADGDTVLDSGGYVWSFEVGTTLDLTPPTVESVTPSAGSTPDRNITVQITFSEAVDPTSATGTRSTDAATGLASGFSAIQTVDATSAIVDGTYAISNGYRTVTFTSDDACGTNSCGETIYCLPASQLMEVTAYAASVSTTDPPQASALDGITDMSGNALDGNGDDTAGDDYAWNFTTTGDINLDAPSIETITPDISEEDVDLDQSVEITFDSILMSSSLDGSITLANEEQTTQESHEMWFTIRTTPLTSGDEEVVDDDTQTAAKTRVDMAHGTFLESVDGLSYLYGATAGSGVKNAYQNCFIPAEGPDADGNACGTTDDAPYCCNGSASADACTLF